MILSYHSNEASNDTFDLMMRNKPDILKFIAPKCPANFERAIHFEMGKGKVLTRICNRYVNYCPVEETVAPGQLIYDDLKKYQIEFNLRPPVFNVYLIGNNISLSPGPYLYNSLFSDFGLDLQYGLLETQELSEVLDKLRSNDCIGASITIPYKETIIQHLDSISEQAKMIGAVNTITKNNGKLIGNNTDWLGIYTPLRNSGKKYNKALILGAGGTCKAALYALKMLKINEIYV